MGCNSCAATLIKKNKVTILHKRSNAQGYVRDATEIKDFLTE